MGGFFFSQTIFLLRRHTSNPYTHDTDREDERDETAANRDFNIQANAVTSLYRSAVYRGTQKIQYTM